MFQLLATDFIRNRAIQLSFAASLLIEITHFKTVKHTMTLLGLPYLTSIVLRCRYVPKKRRMKPRISAQYRNEKALLPLTGEGARRADEGRSK